MAQNDKITEEKIFDAATDVFEEHGLSGARMQEIADRAGINKALLHYYYRSKDRLFEAVFNRLAGKMFERFIGALDNEMSLQQKLEHFYHEHITFLQKHPKLPGFVLHEINQNPERLLNAFGNERLQKIRNNLFAQLDAEIAAGHIAPIDKAQFLSNLLALSVFPFAARNMLELVLQDTDFNFDDFINQRKTLLPEFMMNAVRAK